MTDESWLKIKNLLWTLHRAANSHLRNQVLNVLDDSDCHFFTQSVSQFSRSVVSDSLRPHESQHARPPCPSPAPGVHWDPRPSSQWCHPAISSSVIRFSSCPQFRPASESFPMSQLFAWGGQSSGVSALTSYSKWNSGST